MPNSATKLCPRCRMIARVSHLIQAHPVQTRADWQKTATDIVNLVTSELAMTDTSTTCWFCDNPVRKALEACKTGDWSTTGLNPNSFETALRHALMLADHEAEETERKRQATAPIRPLFS